MHIFETLAAKFTQLCMFYANNLILLLNRIEVFLGSKLKCSAQTKREFCIVAENRGKQPPEQART